jgi:hypothetical protein
MKSPFAVAAAQAIPSLCFKPIDEKRASINKYVRIQMRIRHKLESSNSLNYESNISKKREFIHMPDVGTLMVYKKKPFSVRFDPAAFEKDTIGTKSI